MKNAQLELQAVTLKRGVHCSCAGAYVLQRHHANIGSPSNMEQAEEVDRLGEGVPQAKLTVALVHSRYSLHICY